jgi:endonuclease YncB( thermonuclease family)
MTGPTKAARRCGEFCAAALPLALLFATPGPAAAAGCAFEPQGEGRVAAIIDARGFRLEDGREVRLAGIEPIAAEQAGSTSTLSAILKGHDVTLRGENDTPDRYGRQAAFVFLDDSESSVQEMLLGEGEALVAAGQSGEEVGDKRPKC